MESSKNKRTYVLLGILVLCGVVWFLMRPSDEVVLDTTGGVGNEVVSASAIALLQKVQSVNFDFSLLQTAEFLRLVDRSSPLPNFPVGRDNPFAPAP